MAKAGRWEPKAGRSPSKDIVVDQVRDLVDHRLSHEALRGAAAVRAHRSGRRHEPAGAERAPQDAGGATRRHHPGAGGGEPRRAPAHHPLALPARLLRPHPRRAGGRHGSRPRAGARRRPAWRRRWPAAPWGGRWRSIRPSWTRCGTRCASPRRSIPDDALGWLAFARVHGEDRDAGGRAVRAARRSGCATCWRRRPAAASPALLDLAGETGRAAAALAPAEVVRRRGEVAWTALALRQNASPVLALERLFIRWFSGWFAWPGLGPASAGAGSGRLARRLPGGGGGRQAPAGLPVRRRRLPVPAGRPGGGPRPGAGGGPGLNLVELDAAASPAEVAAELSTAGLFGGGKVVLVQEPAFLSSRRTPPRRSPPRPAPSPRAGSGRGRGACWRWPAKAGLGARALTPGPDGRVSAEARQDAGRRAGGGARRAAAAFVDAAARFAAERELKVAKGDDAGALDAALARGFPPGHVLLVAAGQDRRAAAAGEEAGGGRAARHRPRWRRRGSGTRSGRCWGRCSQALLAGTGKRVDRGGEAALAERVGDDARVLASEVQKLCAYVGDRKVIGAADVEAVVTRVASRSLLRAGERGRGARPAAGAGRCSTAPSPTAPARSWCWARWPARCGGWWPSGSGGGRCRRRPAHRLLRRVAAAPVLPSIPEEELGAEEALRVLDEVPGRHAVHAGRSCSPRWRAWPRPTWP